MTSSSLEKKYSSKIYIDQVVGYGCPPKLLFLVFKIKIKKCNFFTYCTLLYVLTAPFKNEKCLTQISSRMAITLSVLSKLRGQNLHSQMIEQAILSHDLNLKTGCEFDGFSSTYPPIFKLSTPPPSPRKKCCMIYLCLNLTVESSFKIVQKMAVFKPTASESEIKLFSNLKMYLAAGMMTMKSSNHFMCYTLPSMAACRALIGSTSVIKTRAPNDFND